MATISYATTGVTVDFCVEGHGVWFDKGEFQAIIEALEKEIVEKNISDYVTASLEEAKEIVTGDEGFISEWKDFLTVTRLLQYRVLAENPKVAELLIALQLTSPFK
jgi:Zn-finger nucleic acid-binding protein